jgi:hypothetical protein
MSGLLPDEDTTFLTNESIQPTIHAKAENLRLVEVVPTSPAQTNKFLWVGAIGVLGSLLGALFTFWRERQILTMKYRKMKGQNPGTVGY